MITEKQLLDLEMCDEYSLRHHHDDVIDLIASYRELSSVPTCPALPAVGSTVKLKDGPEVQVLCHAKQVTIDVAIVQDGPYPRVCRPTAFEGYPNESI